MKGQESLLAPSPPPTPFVMTSRASNATLGALPRLSVSGQSAGGSMAIQHLFAFSSLVDGAAIAAGSPYGCGSLEDSDDSCMSGPTHMPDLLNYVKKRELSRKIDLTDHLRRTPVVLYSGKSDKMVYKKVMLDTERQLKYFVDADKLVTEFNTWGGHVWPIDHGRCACGTCPYGGFALLECCNVNNCALDLSGELLRATYPRVRPRVRTNDRLYWIDQWKYFPDPGKPPAFPRTVMQWMVAYVATGCESAPSTCRIHINYHGCVAPSWPARLNWVSHLDLNEYAEANRMVVLYPQSQGSFNSSRT